MNTRDYTLGNHLRELRHSAKLTREELAEKAGVSRDLIAKVEQGSRGSMRHATARMLAGALGVPVGQLLGDDTAQEVRDRLAGARVRELRAALGIPADQVDAVLAMGARVRRLLDALGVPPGELEEVIALAARLHARPDVRALASVITTP